MRTVGLVVGHVLLSLRVVLVVSSLLFTEQLQELPLLPLSNRTK